MLWSHFPTAVLFYSTSRFALFIYYSWTCAPAQEHARRSPSPAATRRARALVPGRPLR